MAATTTATSICAWTTTRSPIDKLAELVTMHHLFFGEVDPANLIPLADVAERLQALLQRTGHYHGPVSGEFDEATRRALRALVGSENLEERWDGTGDQIDRVVVDYLLKRLGCKRKEIADYTD